MNYKHRFPLDGFYRDKPSLRPAHRVADRLSIILNNLAARPVHKHVMWGHELDREAELRELAAPVVRAAARLDPDFAGRELRKEPQHLRALQMLAQSWLLMCIHPMHLRDLLRNVQPNSHNRCAKDRRCPCHVAHGFVRHRRLLEDHRAPLHKEVRSGLSHNRLQLMHDFTNYIDTRVDLFIGHRE